MLAHDGVIFHDLHLLGMQPAILRRRVVVTGAGRRHQSNLVAHGLKLPLDVLTLGAQVGKDLLNALLVDDPQTLARNAQPHEALLVLEPETLPVQIRQETALRLVVRVGNVVTNLWSLSGNLTNSCHIWLIFALFKRDCKYRQLTPNYPKAISNYPGVLVKKAGKSMLRAQDHENHQ